MRLALPFSNLDKFGVGILQILQPGMGVDGPTRGTSQAALLVYDDRRVEEVLVGSFGYETLQPVLLSYGGASAAIPLSAVRAVLPPERPRGLLRHVGYA